ncbi:hypothetical protein [Streptomyces echinatus]|uniref:hypothetical protein n=1 Tax=Streptomyces echinatus TaxID=67293 RepID=UPI00379CC4C6
MASTLAALTHRGPVSRGPDPTGGRRAVVTVTEEGRAVPEQRRSGSVSRLARALHDCTPRARQAPHDVVPPLDRSAEAL